MDGARKIHVRLGVYLFGNYYLGLFEPRVKLRRVVPFSGTAAERLGSGSRLGWYEHLGRASFDWCGHRLGKVLGLS